MRTLMIAMALISCAPFAAADGPKSKAQDNGPDWTLTGWETTTCCCNDICPCRVNERPTHGECEATISVHIDKGMYGDTKLDGVNFILVSRGLEATDKGWNKVYIDKRATPEQQKAIGGVLTTIISSYKPETASLVFGKESRGVK